ncbi:hypothetical protein, partial [Candidatus Vampirococcus lugosii]
SDLTENKEINEKISGSGDLSEVEKESDTYFKESGGSISSGGSDGGGGSGGCLDPYIGNDCNCIPMDSEVNCRIVMDDAGFNPLFYKGTEEGEQLDDKRDLAHCDPDQRTYVYIEQTCFGMLCMVSTREENLVDYDSEDDRIACKSE